MRPEIDIGPVLLRKYEFAFAPLLLEAVNTSCSPAFTHFAPWAHAAYSLADSARFITQSEADWQDGTAFNFAVFQAQTGVFCGGIGLNQPNQGHGFYNLGYWVRLSQQRQGIGALATRRLAQATFRDLPTIQRLEILTSPDNIASQRTALKAGATREGRLRQRLRVGDKWSDAVLFSLVKTDVLL